MRRNDTISRATAIKAIDGLPNSYNGYSDCYDKACIIGVLEEVPPVDAIQVIRCNECKHHDDEYPWCEKLQRETENDCYCSLAKRRNCND